MTTDVINGVPRSLLERCVLLAQDAMGLDFDEHAAIERDIRELLATAQPADHSEHDLNMVSQPAADGEREVWAVPVLDGEKKTTFYTEQLPFVPGIGVKQLGEPVRMVEARAAQPAADGEREAFEAELQILGFTRRGIATLRCGGEYINEKVQACWTVWQARAAQPQQAVAVTDEVGRLREALAKAKGVLEEVWEFSYEHGAASALSARDMAEEISVALSAHKTGEEE